MAKASEIVAKAKAEVGVKESPANSNIVKYWDYYKKMTGVNYNGQPWCAAFVSWVMWTCGVWNTKKDEGYLRYCPSLVNKAKKDGTWLGRTSDVEPGDIVLFANSSGTACHVGIVEKKLSNTKVRTFEGNTSAGNNANGGEVQNRIRDFGTVGSSWYILGFMRPEYEAEKKTTTTKTEVVKYDDIKSLCKLVQSKLGVVADGEFGPKTKNAWEKNVGYISKTKNNKIKLVQYIQKALITKGYSLPKYGADGDFGSETHSAILKFQKANKLTADGKVGKMTAEKLFN